MFYPGTDLHLSQYPAFTRVVFFMVLGSSCVVGIHYVNLVLCVDDGCEMVNIMLAQIVWQRESRRKQHHKHVLGLICDNSVV